MLHDHVLLPLAVELLGCVAPVVDNVDVVLLLVVVDLKSVVVLCDVDVE